MKKPNKILSAGLFIVGITLLLKHLLIQMPDFLQGLGMGIGLGLELIGIYSMNHDISKLKNHKMNLMRRCLNK